MSRTRPLPWALEPRAPDRAALVVDGREVSFAELRRAADEVGLEYGRGRRLVAIAAENSCRFMLSYLGAMRCGHVALLAPPCRLDELVDRYLPDAVATADGVQRLSRNPRHDLHPQLAVLLSTSGSTGSPKLVRLSRGSLAANAASIAESLDLTRDDRAMTTLSPGYSYGLSVINSHLAVGGSIVLTNASVTEERFLDLARRHEVTTLAAVPHMFELLDRVGFAGDEIPSLRLVTCAGGRLPTDVARRYAALGASSGWSLALMYGQTEATARIACLPVDLTALHADTVGRAIPGGSITIADPGPDGAGDIVYRGPNVMMGYATSREDLARGPETAELRTGDRGRLTPEGLLQVVGRRDDFAKIRGLRIDLADVSRALREADVDGAVVEVDGNLGVVAREAAPSQVLAVVRAATRLPASAIAVVVADVPRTVPGKVDLAAVRGLVAAARDRKDLERSAFAIPREERIAAAYARVFGRPVTWSDSFVSLGGDSLSYVAASICVERVLGVLPPRWHERSVAQLVGDAAPTADPSRRRSIRVRGRDAEFGVVLRAAAIVAIVGSHALAFELRGGAHLLVALAGYNLARFQLVEGDVRRRLKRMARCTARVLAPAFVWIAAVAAVTSTYTFAALGINWVLNFTTDNPDWRYWFVEALVWFLPLAAITVSIPAVEACRRNHPVVFPASLAVLAWGGYMVFIPDQRPTVLLSPPAVLWLFLLGWAAAEARTVGHRAGLSLVMLAIVPVSFEGQRVVTVSLGVLLLLWVPRLRVPGPMLIVMAALAEASLIIFLTHWQVLEFVGGWRATAVALAVGLAVHRAFEFARGVLPRVSGLADRLRPGVRLPVRQLRPDPR